MIKLNVIIDQIEPETDYSISDVAHITGLSYSCVMGHVKRENLQSRLIFGKMHISGSDLIEYLKTGRNPKKKS
jgi:hypothetical protein